MAKNKKPKNRISVIRLMIVIGALSVFVYSAYQLYDIMHGYIKVDQEYTELAREYTKPSAKPVQSDEKKERKPKKKKEGTITTTHEKGYIEDAEVPVDVDWEGLKAQNSDTVGWIYMEGFPENSYPIMQGEDNQTYIHSDFNKEYLYAGCIFLDYENSPDFSDPNSIVYGHNMKNGSMFAPLKKLKDQETYDQNPYFWILTPNGNYRYHIYAVFDTTPKSPIYSLWNMAGDNFLEWEKELQKASAVKNNVLLTAKDHTVVLSTCTPDHDHRTVVIGRCCSSEQPPQKVAEDE